ncbi:MAG: hypothetical protein ACP5MX_00520 [Candidatus Micrarchaeia archaeon]
MQYATKKLPHYDLSKFEITADHKVIGIYEEAIKSWLLENKIPSFYELPYKVHIRDIEASHHPDFTIGIMKGSSVVILNPHSSPDHKFLELQKSIMSNGFYVIVIGSRSETALKMSLGITNLSDYVNEYWWMSNKEHETIDKIKEKLDTMKQGSDVKVLDYQDLYSIVSNSSCISFENNQSSSKMLRR